MNKYMCMLDVHILHARFLENLALDLALKSFEAIEFFVTYVHFEAGRTS